MHFSSSASYMRPACRCPQPLLGELPSEATFTKAMARLG